MLLLLLLLLLFGGGSSSNNLRFSIITGYRSDRSGSERSERLC